MGFGVVGARYPLAGWYQCGVLVAGPGCITSLPGPASEVGAAGQGLGVLGSEYAFAGRHQRGEHVAGSGRVTRCAYEIGEIGAGG